MLDSGYPGAIRPLDPAGGVPAGDELDYLEAVYWWAYLRPASIAIFDHAPVVSAILWGNYRRLVRCALAGIAPGERVLQLACVYGDMSQCLARRVGAEGRLDIVDAAPIQVNAARRKLATMPWATARVADAAAPGPGRYDTVIAFFLLHELPDAHKRRVVDAALARIGPGGKAVFIDYHRPARWHPLRPVMAAVYGLLEPFAATLWRREIASFASRPGLYSWRKTTLFGGLYQCVVVTPVARPGGGTPEEERPVSSGRPARFLGPGRSRGGP